MRQDRRRTISSRTRAVPARSRMTVRRTIAALRRSREALADVEAELDALLATLREPTSSVDAAAPDRLRGATDEANAALAVLLTEP